MNATGKSSSILPGDTLTRAITMGVTHHSFNSHTEQLITGDERMVWQTTLQTVPDSPLAGTLETVLLFSNTDQLVTEDQRVVWQTTLQTIPDSPLAGTLETVLLISDTEQLITEDHRLVQRTTLQTIPDSPLAGTLETVLLISYLTVALLWTVVANTRIFHLILSRDMYHQPYYYIMASYSISDTVLVASSTPLMIAGMLLREDYVNIPQWICAISGVFTAGPVFISIHILGFMAVERYYFFVKPLRYVQRFTSRFTLYILALVWIMAFMFALVIEFLGRKQFYITILHCQTPSAKVFTYIQILLYLLPTLCSTLFSLVKLWVLQTSHQARVNDVATVNTAFQRSAKKFNKSKGTAIKIIMLTSGSFWFTFLPIGIFRLVVFSHGVTWGYLDSFQSPILSYVFRYLNVSLYTLSSALNPAIFMYTHKPLRRQFFNGKCSSQGEIVDLTTVQTSVG